MRDTARPFLLDVTRLVALSWTARRATGIDRVCHAYLKNFRSRALAAIQYRGVMGTLGPRRSALLFDLLSQPEKQFHKELLKFVPSPLTGHTLKRGLAGATYINVSHTDFHLDRHTRWLTTNRIRPVYFLHDLIPIIHPEICRPLAVRHHTLRVKKALQFGAGIIVNSRATAMELWRFAREQGMKSPNLVVSPLAGTDLQEAFSLPQATTMERKTRAADPFFVSVGTIEPRKNYLMLLRIWQRLVERLGDNAPRLVIIGQWGQDRSFVRQVQEAAALLRDHVQFMIGSTDEALASKVRDARALLLPTLAEGFGLPLVEALKAGTPVIASDLPSFREMGQDIPLLLPPGAEDIWEKAIMNFDDTSSDRLRQIRVLPAFKAPSWDDHFSIVEPWLETLSQLEIPEFRKVPSQCLSA